MTVMILHVLSIDKGVHSVIGRALCLRKNIFYSFPLWNLLFTFQQQYQTGRSNEIEIGKKQCRFISQQSAFAIDYTPRRHGRST